MRDNPVVEPTAERGDHKLFLQEVTQLHAAMTVDDLRMPPSNRFWRPCAATVLGNGAFASTINGVCAFGLRMEMRLTLKLPTTTEETAP